MKIEKFKDINPLFYVIAVVILIFLLKFLNMAYYSARLKLALNAYCNVESVLSVEEKMLKKDKKTYSKKDCQENIKQSFKEILGHDVVLEDSISAEIILDGVSISKKISLSDIFKCAGSEEEGIYGGTFIIDAKTGEMTPIKGPSSEENEGTYSKESCKNVVYNKINDRIETVCEKRLWYLGKRAVKNCAKEILKDEIQHIYYKKIPHLKNAIVSCKKDKQLYTNFMGCGYAMYGYNKNVKKESSIFFNYF